MCSKLQVTEARLQIKLNALWIRCHGNEQPPLSMTTAMDGEPPLFSLWFDLVLIVMPLVHATHKHSQDTDNLRPQQDLPYAEFTYISEAMSKMAGRTEAYFTDSEK